MRRRKSRRQLNLHCSLGGGKSVWMSTKSQALLRRRKFERQLNLDHRRADGYILNILIPIVPEEEEEEFWKTTLSSLYPRRRQLNINFS